MLASVVSQLGNQQQDHAGIGSEYIQLDGYAIGVGEPVQ